MRAREQGEERKHAAIEEYQILILMICVSSDDIPLVYVIETNLIVLLTYALLYILLSVSDKYSMIINMKTEIDFSCY